MIYSLKFQFSFPINQFLRVQQLMLFSKIPLSSSATMFPNKSALWMRDLKVLLFTILTLKVVASSLK